MIKIREDFSQYHHQKNNLHSLSIFFIILFVFFFLIKSFLFVLQLVPFPFIFFYYLLHPHLHLPSHLPLLLLLLLLHFILHFPLDCQYHYILPQSHLTFLLHHHFQHLRFILILSLICININLKIINKYK